MKKDPKTRPVRLTKRMAAERLVEIFDAEPNRLFDARELFQLLRAKNHCAKMTVLDAAQDLILDDVIAVNNQGRYRAARRSATMDGTFVRKSNGRNSFIPDDGGKSILVCERNSLHAMDGDRVRASLLARRKDHAREAEIVEILERRVNTFVGTLQVKNHYAFLVPDGKRLATDIFIPIDRVKGGRDGETAVVRVTSWPEEGRSPEGEVIDVLGKRGENDTEMHAILAEFGLPYTYPRNVERAADRISAAITPQDEAEREDFRGVPTFTIDPHDAKDFDDALSIRRSTTRRAGVWEVGVHIADVSHYVREGDLIDREAQERSTSVYLVDRTIPMLPERLCNYICSLRPQEDKLAYSVIFELTEEGKVLDWHLAHTIIRSCHRFTYEEAQDLLERHGEASREDPPVHYRPETKTPVEGETPTEALAQEIILLNRLAKRLREARFRRGSIAFDRPEVRFDIDENGHPLATYLKIARDANRLVEEFMLLANRTVAESIGRTPKGRKPKTLPYRIHDVPDPEKLEKLSGFIARFGLKIRTEGSKKEISKSLNRLLGDVKGRPEENLVELVALRAMQKARYSTENIGHYGLMFDYYTHFTSPIRRYPDLMVHRLLTRYAEGARSASVAHYEALCEHASAQEQQAALAERASIKYKQVEFMADRLGQEFDGVVSGVTEFGLYVEEVESHCEGMVPIHHLLDDYYEFDEPNFRLVGRRTHRRYELGQKVRFRVARAQIVKRLLDFELVDEQPASPQPLHKTHNAKPGRLDVRL